MQALFKPKTNPGCDISLLAHDCFSILTLVCFLSGPDNVCVNNTLSQSAQIIPQQDQMWRHYIFQIKSHRKFDFPVSLYSCCCFPCCISPGCFLMTNTNASCVSHTPPPSPRTWQSVASRRFWTRLKEPSQGSISACGTVTQFILPTQRQTVTFQGLHGSYFSTYQFTCSFLGFFEWLHVWCYANTWQQASEVIWSGSRSRWLSQL